MKSLEQVQEIRLAGNMTQRHKTSVLGRERERDDHRQLLKNALPIIPFLSPLNDRAN